MPRIKKTELWIMLAATVRYSMGRRTYMPSVCRNLIRKYRGHLDKRQIKQIRDEIQDELSMDLIDMGDQCDIDCWKGIVNDIDDFLSKDRK